MDLNNKSTLGNIMSASVVSIIELFDAYFYFLSFLIKCKYQIQESVRLVEN